MCCHAISIKPVERQHECHPSHRLSRFCFLDVFKLVSNYMKKILPKLSFFIIANGASLTFVHERGSRRMWRTQKTFCLVQLFTNMKICLANMKGSSRRASNKKVADSWPTPCLFLSFIILYQAFVHKPAFRLNTSGFHWNLVSAPLFSPCITFLSGPIRKLIVSYYFYS